MESHWEWSSSGISFFPVRKGSCVVLETTSVDHGDIPTGFFFFEAVRQAR